MTLTATQALHRGVAAHKQGELDEAERLYRAILQSQPNRTPSSHGINVIAVAYNNLGFVLEHKGDLDATIESYRLATQIKPDFHEAFNNLGSSLQRKGDLNAAIENFRQAIRIKPTFSEAHYNLGHALQEKGDLKAAVESYQQLISIEPDNADAFNALGAVLHLRGDLTAAINSYKQALTISPELAEAYNNMGNSQLALGDVDAAIESCNRSIRLKPDYANAYNNLGYALNDKGDLRGAIDSFKTALRLQPDSAQIYNNLGSAHREIGEIDAALKCFDALNEPRFSKLFEANPTQNDFWLNTRSQSLECLYILGRYAELEQRLKVLAKSGDINRRVAAVSAFVCQQLKIDNPHTFCKQPLDFVHVGNLDNHVADVPGFVESLISEGRKENQVWEPKHGVTKSGFQTANTIFDAGENCAALEKILRKEIASYYAKFKDKDCAFMKLWPENYNLKGWFTRLIKHGHQRSHIHPAGWLSGVVYLKTIDSPVGDEGAIEMGLHGNDLPILDSGFDRRTHSPQRGEIVLFPSSLFHRTIPYNTDEERCVIAFDLHPCLY